MSKNHVLAMYDIAGKQEFIFRHSTIKQIIGASNIIRDLFKDYLFPSAEQYKKYSTGCKDRAIYDYTAIGSNNQPFSLKEFEDHIENDGYIGEVIYEGGGNFLILYKDESTCVEINKIFTRKILENIGSLRVICTYIDVELDEEKSDFKKDRDMLYVKHRINQNKFPASLVANSMPFTQIETETSMPLSYMEYHAERVGKEKLSLEGHAKYKKYYSLLQSEKNNFGEKLLENLIYKKYEDSMLAVIFIDGNNMGAQVQQCLKGKKNYSECINELRRFSSKIQKEYVEDRIEAITKDINSLDNKNEWNKEILHRFVVSAGDEMSFIVPARLAYKAIEAYFKDLPEDDSACAGVAIFHSHSPYHEAYKIAEECCENCKSLMKKNRETDSCYFDFHLCQGGLGMSLDTIRTKDHEDGIISRPWLIRGKSKTNQPSINEIKRVLSDLKCIGSRTTIKDLVTAAKQSQAEFVLNVMRIYAHQPDDIKKNIEYTFKDLSGKYRRKLIYDIGIIYDEWFRW